MTFYFYDLETSGISAKYQRIFQFAGQRTDENLNPIGEPHNFLIKATEDVLPDPSAVLITGITPQSTLSDGLTEAEFLELFYKEIATPETCFAGFNTIRFDDEFIRYLNYRNFRDPYEWQWKDKRCRWDMMDVLRMTRALRPGNIIWPSADDGMAVNKLEVIAAENNLIHDKAHDALSDVNATIAVARMLHKNQPKLWVYLKANITKSAVVDMLNSALKSRTPLVHTSSKLETDFLKTSVVVPVFENNQGATYVYDLRYNPDELAGLSDEELSRRAFSGREDLGDTPRLPVKGVHHNRAPALAPLGVLDSDAEKRIGLTKDQALENLTKLAKNKELMDRCRKIILNHAYTESKASEGSKGEGPIMVDDVDGKLYDGFIGHADKSLSSDLVQLRGQSLKAFDSVFADKRLNQLLPLYKARNFPDTLTEEEREAWAKHCHIRIGTGGERSRINWYFGEIQRLASEGVTPDQEYLLEELLLWGQTIAPAEGV